MLYAIIGEYGDGKNTLSTAAAYLAHLKGMTVYSNYFLEFPHIPVRSISDIDKMKSGTFIMDEAWYTFDSRNYGSAGNKKGSIVLSKLRKRKVDSYFVMQSLDLIDSRFRDRMNAILIPNLIKDSNGVPSRLTVDVLKKSKWGGYVLHPTSFTLDVSKTCHMFNTDEELEPLKL